MKFLAALATLFGLSPAAVPIGNKPANQIAAETARRTRAAHGSRKRRPRAYAPRAPALPVVPFYDRPPSAALIAHRAGIRLAAEKAGPMYTPRKAAA